jgi:predicted dehydrogenase
MMQYITRAVSKASNQIKINQNKKRKGRFPVAVVGLGAWGNQYVRELLLNGHYEIKAVFDGNIEAGKKTARKYKIPYAKDFIDLLDNYGAKAVFVLTPNAVHYEQLEESIKRRLHVYVEKPLTNSLQDADRIAELADANGIKVYVAHSMKLGKAFAEAKRLIETGLIGKVHLFEANRSLGNKRITGDSWRDNKELCPVRPMLQLGIHFLDVVQFLFGDILQIEAMERNDVTQNELSDVIAVLIKTKECIGQISCSYATENTYRMSIYGTDGRIDINEEKMEMYQKGAKRTLYHDLKRENLIQIELNEFYLWVKENKAPINSCENGVKMVRYINKIKERIEND